VSAARNRGISEVRTDLIAFLDADDEWKPDFLQQIRRIWKDFPDCGAYATYFETVMPNGENVRRPLPTVPPPPWIGIIPCYFRLLLVQAPFYSSSICIQGEVFNTLGAFPVGVRRGEDFIMWAKVALHYPIGYSPSPQVVYHTEAENRACNIFPPSLEEESPAAAFIRSVVQNKNPESDLCKDLMEIHAHEEIVRAALLIRAGGTRLALTLLEKCKPRTATLRRRKSRLMALTRMPQALRQLALRPHRNDAT
jgi:glycosyltransferase involved in cell wall biosynthesis